MPRYQLRHRHEVQECRVVFAAWRGFSSPLRHRPTTGTCALGGHELWWEVETTDDEAALALLPPYVAERTRAVEVGDILIP
jgi:hypothetical protein